MSNDNVHDNKNSHDFNERASPRTAAAPAPAVEEMIDHYAKFPNAWSHVRYRFREAFAEFFGTMILVLFGDGVLCQVVLGGNTRVSPTPKGDFLSISFGWGIGVALGVWVSGGISGGHINPAVTLAMAVTRRFPWKKVPLYMLSQLLGALFGAAILYANYFHAINAFEGGNGIRTVPGTAGLFATYALDYLPDSAAFFDEFLGTAILLLCLLAVTDTKNLAPMPGLLPLALFLVVTGIGMAFGMQTGFAINPARDLGPRILTAMAGYGKGVFTFRGQYWLWCSVLAPFAGAVSGALVYDIFMFRGAESIINSPNAAAKEMATNTPRPNFQDV